MPLACSPAGTRSIGHLYDCLFNNPVLAFSSVTCGTSHPPKGRNGVSERKRFIIGSKSDAVSIEYMNRTILSLREAHPRLEFVGWPELLQNCKVDEGVHRDLTGALHALTRKEFDILVVDAREVSLRHAAKVERAAVTRRGNPYDVFVSQGSTILDELPEKSRLAADMPVRRGQLLFYRPDLTLVEESGDFRYFYKLLDTGEISGFVCNASDVEALNMQDRVAEVFTSSICMPTANQGAHMVFVRKDDHEALSIVRDINDSASAREIEIERAFITHIAKNGKGPIGVLANVEGDSFKVEAAVAAPDGSEKVSGNCEGRLDSADPVLEKLAFEMLESGAREILAAFK
jgi:hydroxymethylbilane synthase